MADGTTPSNQAGIDLNKLEELLNRAEVGEALGLIQEARNAILRGDGGETAEEGPQPANVTELEAQSQGKLEEMRTAIEDANEAMYIARSVMLLALDVVFRVSGEIEDRDDRLDLDTAHQALIGARIIVENTAHRLGEAL